ncbi:hypothetical protein P170DRAFT_237366 [Aspergillus steynii IBT 23096]|uniref:Transmembrane protein n=1 Tax=Aspergillus steynii IBT 23096 TaxID=1392250 RepID=A0A2I2G309_9EURO|nr:uncharacterized protein P170DRAFT_237366 [Aspergillus steynii IBT 23096]PLB47259.1 hypothetical protein P170DRAFT_237366 [Aspergillus steynii IBT 23096]
MFHRPGCMETKLPRKSKIDNHRFTWARHALHGSTYAHLFSLLYLLLGLRAWMPERSSLMSCSSMGGGFLVLSLFFAFFFSTFFASSGYFLSAFNPPPNSRSPSLRPVYDVNLTAKPLCPSPRRFI